MLVPVDKYAYLHLTVDISSSLFELCLCSLKSTRFLAILTLCWADVIDMSLGDRYSYTIPKVFQMVVK